MIALALLLVALAPDDGIADQIAHCGIPRDQISARYEDVLQDETATITTPAAALTSTNLNCLVGLAQSGRWFAFTDPAAQARYDPLIQASDRKAAQQEARQWLTEHGLLATLPIYDAAHQSVGDFGIALERFCGAGPGTMLTPDGPRLRVTPPSDPQMNAASLRRFECMVSAILVSDPDQRIFTMGFTGNEAVKRPDE